MGSNRLRRAWRDIRRVARLLRWGGATVSRAAGIQRSNRRLLMIYDFASQPLSVGDILIFQESSLVLRATHDLGQIDFALVYDPKQPVVADPALAHFDPESFLYHLSSFLPAAQVNPHLGAVLFFDSHTALESYIGDNCHRYHVWPTLRQYTGREYLFYYCFDHLFYDYFEQHGNLPSLASRPAARIWAERFLEEHARSETAITVQLRRNPQNPARNSDYEAWIAFFASCATRYAAKFIVICGRGEIDTRLRTLNNVIVAKDHGTSVEQDLALIEVGRIHMGACSGPATMAQFSSKPYCMFNALMDDGFIKSFKREGDRGRFTFSNAFQNWIAVKETPESLQTEFERMWAAIADESAHVAARG
jgi:hypothetical protein